MLVAARRSLAGGCLRISLTVLEDFSVMIVDVLARLKPSPTTLGAFKLDGFLLGAFRLGALTLGTLMSCAFTLDAFILFAVLVLIVLALFIDFVSNAMLMDVACRFPRSCGLLMSPLINLTLFMPPYGVMPSLYKKVFCLLLRTDLGVRLPR